MFSKQIIDSDAFLGLSIPAQVLYFHLGILAADKGIVNNTKAICRELGISCKNITELQISGYLKQTDEKTLKITHWDINNGMAETAHKRISYQYRKWRENVLARDNYLCTKCGSKNNLEAHHIEKFSECENKRYELHNGITLCTQCHRKLHKAERENANGRR